jgi:hypothetical protein
MQDLPLEIRKVDDVGIHEPHAPYPRGGEVESYWRTQSARANAENARGLEFLLSLKGYLGHDQVPRVPRNFVIAEVYIG